MTEQQSNQTSDGQITPVQPEQLAPQPTIPPFDENEPLLDSLRRPRRALSSAPTFTPQTFSQQIQLVDDGVSKTLYAYINGEWVQVSGGGGVAGNDKDIQFNDSGSMGADDDFQWDKNSKELLFNEDTTILGASGGTGEVGKSIFIQAGDGDIDGGGEVSLFAGNKGGITSINGGSGDGDNGIPGGDAVVAAGSAIGTNADGGNAVLKAIAGQGTGKSGTVSMRSNIDSAKTDYVNGRDTTTNATPKTLAAIDFPTMASSSSLFIQARIIAKRTGGSAGSDGDSAAYVRRACYKRVGSGAPTLVGSIQDDFTVEDQAGWDATFVVSGNDIIVQVTGATNNNISWRYEIIYIRNEF